MGAEVGIVSGRHPAASPPGDGGAAARRLGVPPSEFVKRFHNPTASTCIPCRKIPDSVRPPRAYDGGGVSCGHRRLATAGAGHAGPRRATTAVCFTGASNAVGATCFVCATGVRVENLGERTCCRPIHFSAHASPTSEPSWRATIVTTYCPGALQPVRVHELNDALTISSVRTKPVLVCPDMDRCSCGVRHEQAESHPASTFASRHDRLEWPSGSVYSDAHQPISPRVTKQ